MGLGIGVAVALLLHVVHGTHRDTSGYGNFGTTDSGPFWGPPETTVGVTEKPAAQTTPSPVRWNILPNSYSSQAIQQRSRIFRGPFTRRIHSPPQSIPRQQRPFLSFSPRFFERGHRKIFLTAMTTPRPTTTTTTAAPMFDTSIFRLWRDRQSMIQNEQDRQQILHYLFELYRLRTLLGYDSESVLDSQIELIDSIRNNLIKREVLKIFVKDMVERSGVLRRNVTAQDMDAIGALIDRISLITSQVNLVRDQLADFSTPSDDFMDSFIPALATMEQTRAASDMLTLGTFPPVWNTRPNVPRRRQFFPQPGDRQRLLNFAGRRRPTVPPLSGLRVFANSPLLMNRPTTTARPSSTEIKRGKLRLTILVPLISVCKWKQEPKKKLVSATTIINIWFVILDKHNIMAWRQCLKLNMEAVLVPFPHKLY